MKQRSELRDWLPPTGRIVGVALFVIAALGIAYVASRNPDLPGAGAECRMLYKRAKTAADTDMIDVQRSSLGASKRPNGETCGYLRKLGLTN